MKVSDITLDLKVIKQSLHVSLLNYLSTNITVVVDMFSVHPLETWFHERRQKNIHMSHNEVLEAVRYAMIAVLDLVNYYEQISAVTRDESVKRVFTDLARLELENLGMLMGLLARMDPAYSRKIREGLEKLEKRLGIKVEF
jgi:hypothetical protein